MHGSVRARPYLIRYADDFVACFEHEADARAFLTEMRERLAKFDLEIEPSKTALLQFGSAMLGRPRVQCQGPRTFSFLGFTHYVGRSRTGRFVVGRKTDGKRLRKKLKALNARLRDLRTEGGNAMVAFLARHLQGHIQYYGVSGNSRGLSSYVYFAQRLLFKWLNRRSQKRSLNWKQFSAYIRRCCPRLAFSTTFTPSLGGCLRLGAGWCNTPSPVLRGAGNELRMVKILWHRRETRRKTEKTNVDLNTVRPRLTLRLDFNFRATHWARHLPSPAPLA